ncbi:hypothetical protein Mapa_006152 [Marchantia paleacea]|nr:hypothetical protein Mapa_006152 [Marchantia paleacea]
MNRCQPSTNAATMHATFGGERGRNLSSGFHSMIGWGRFFLSGIFHVVDLWVVYLMDEQAGIFRLFGFVIRASL